MDASRDTVEAGLAARSLPGGTFQHFVGPPGRARLVCAILLADPDEPLWLRRLSRVARLGFSGLDAELRHLEAMRLIRRSARGGACFFELDESQPLVPSLRAVIAAAKLTDELLLVPKYMVEHQRLLERCHSAPPDRS